MHPTCFVALCLLAAVQLTGVSAEGKRYGLPNPVRRYSLVPPVQRSATTKRQSSSPIASASTNLGMPNPNAPIYASDYSPTGYFQPETNPQYIRNATCTWVKSVHLNAHRLVYWLLDSKCMWFTACVGIHGCLESIQLWISSRLRVSS